MSKRCMGCMELLGNEFEVCPHCGYIAGTPAEEAIHMEPGTMLADRYIVGKVLGFGGFGVTYVGWDGKLEQKVAIKEYLPSDFSTRMPGQSSVTIFNGEKSEQFADGLKKFVEEAKRLAKFQNEPGIVKIFDTFTENETAYIIMEYLEGETLTERLRREKRIPEDEAVAMLTPVMESLKVVHEEGILHRDIAPDNIFLTKDGEVKLIDFGASRYATTSHSRSLTVIIKSGYSPEEQYRSRGDQGPHTDVYAIAATLYKMITGKTPPDAMERHAKMEIQKKDLLEEPHKLCKEISVNRENAILNAANIRIEDRTPDIQTFMDELNADPPAKRRKGSIKKIDVYAWPLWLKILVPSLIAIFLVLGVLLATGVISFPSLFSDEIVVPEGFVIVPDVEGENTDEALQTLTKAGLMPSADGNIESEYVAAGKIILQTPMGGSYLEENGTVSLTVSSGAGVVAAQDGKSTVPYVIWDTQEDAVSKLQRAGLSAPNIETKENDNVPAGRVISQSISSGTQVDEGTQITIVVSKGSSASKQSGSSSSGTKSTTTSDWVLESEVPSGATIVSTIYKYERRATNQITNSSSSYPISGWTEYNTSSYWGDYGNWSAWQDSPVSSSTSRDVESRSYIDHYYTEVYVCGNSSGTRCYLSYMQSGYSQRAHWTHDLSPDEYNACSWIGEGGWYNYASNVAGYIIGPGSALYGEATDYVPNFVTGTNKKEQYRYRDRSQYFTHYYEKYTSESSVSYPTGDVRNVQKYVKYKK